MINPVFRVHLGEDEERGVALTLAKVCHFIHPQIVEAIQQINEEDADRLAGIMPDVVDQTAWLYPKSACVFPGIKRYVGRLNPKEKRKYVTSRRAIIDDNEFPRHLWAFLAGGTAYSGPSWQTTGLNQFELGHIFAHKIEERRIERVMFSDFDSSVDPSGLFTCASNVALIPKGLAKPTDHLDSVKKAFFKRYVTLYGEDVLPGLSGLKDAEVPSWFGQLEWSEPLLPDGWEQNIKKLSEYRFRRLKGLFANPLDECGQR